MKNELYYDREKNMRYHKLKFDRIGTYAIDILVYQLPKGTKKGIYILCVLDCYSRLGGCAIQYNKDSKTTLKSYKEIIKDYFFDINGDKLYLDAGGEFEGEFLDYHKELGTKIKICYGDGLRDKNQKLQNSLVERFNKTVRDGLKGLMEEYDDDLNVAMLDEFVNNYNYHNIHSGIKARPIDVFLGDKYPNQDLKKHNIPTRNSKPLEFAIGTKVRISIQFNKMSENAKRIKLNSVHVYEILERKGHKYLLNNGSWYKYSRLMKSKEKLTKNSEVSVEVSAEDDLKPSIPKKKKKIKEIEMNEEEVNKKLRKQPKKLDELLLYNEKWKNHKGYEMKEGKRKH